MNPQKQATKKFVEYWTFNRPGSEKSGCQQYWNMLLGELLGMGDLASGIRYEVPVKLPTTNHQLPTTKYLDAWIPSTRVLIEQKSRGVKLDAPQPGHDNMTPFEQAKFYDDHRPFDEKARWIVTCNFDEIWIYDQTKPLDPPEKIKLSNLPKEYTRLAFLVNTEVKKVAKRELEISVQAGKIVGTLYDALLKQYAEPDSPETLKALNKLCVRLVFCFYAEDADIFDKNIFQKLVTATAAVDLRRKLLTLFQVLDTPTDKRDKYLEPELAAFPYTNGGLYKDATEDEIPPMTEEIKKLLISSSDFDWNGINTTIFGALFESTLNPETRRAGGMVYTSSENIHKQIDPLFLNDLEQRFEEIIGRARTPAAPLSKEQRKKLLELQDYIASLLFLDPASGSGNFLTETYTSLRRLENRIIAAIQGDQPELDLGLRVKVSINQFHGIEINDFAVTVAKTAMWITEAKMARETADILHRDADFLPLKDYDGIVEGNALRMDWATLLRRTGQVPEARFNYIIGNPPFVGHQYRSKEQAADMDVVFADIADTNYGKLDYVCAWYKKALDLIAGTPTHAAFVSTNSICQGESVAAMWKPLFVKGLEIDFAHRSFVWDSDSFEKAHVHVVIIGFHWNDSAAKGYAPSECKPPKAGAMRAAQRGRKVIFAGENIVEAKNINGYLCDAANVFIQNRGGVNYSWLPKMSKGSQPTDGGNLILSPSEREEIILSHPEAAAFILQYLGSEDFINSRLRYCLWLKGVAPNLYRSIPEVMRRLEAVAEMRRKSPTKSVQRDAETPMLFTQIRQPSTNYMAIPEVSSERRKYIPIGFLTPNVIASSKLYVVPDATLWMFGVLTSIVHMAWMRIVAGRLEMRYSYSPSVYNNFPWPFASSLRPPCGENANDESAKAAIEKTAQGILDARALYPDSSLADLYDPLAMPPELRKTHAANDAAVLKAYGWPTDLSEPEIVSRLFDMYAQLTKEGVKSEERKSTCGHPRARKITEKIANESELTEFDRRLILGAREFAKKSIRARFEALEKTPIGDPAKCLMLKEIRTVRAFEDFTFYWGKIAYAVLVNVIYKGQSLLAVERRKWFLEMCESFRLNPMLYRVEASVHSTEPVESDGENVRIEFETCGFGGWGFMDFAMGIETDADMMLATRQPAGEVEMSAWELQVIACRAVRDMLRKNGCEIKSCTDWPGAFPSIRFADPNGRESWVCVEAVRESCESMPDFSEILQDQRSGKLKEMTGYYAQVLVTDGFRGHPIQTDCQGLLPVGEA